MPKPVLLLDLDLTTAATYDLLVQRLNREYGLGLDESKPCQYFGDHTILDERIERSMVDNIFSTQSFFRNLKPIYGAKTAINRLNKHFEIYVVTDPWLKAEHPYTDKLEWVNEHFPCLNGKLIATKFKQLIYGDILIDDHMPFCRTWKQFWQDRQEHYEVKVASLKYSWTDKNIVDIVGRNWCELSDRIMKT